MKLQLEHDETQTIDHRRQARFRADQQRDRSEFLPPGTQLKRYVVLYPVARGGMGVVYAAFDPELDRKVAIKVLRWEVESERLAVGLLAEARVLAQLVHPNVVAVYDVGKASDRLFVAMEFIKGVTLSEWLATGDRGLPEVLQVFIEAGRGLAAAHAARICHHDFKLSNVMLASDGSVRVLDFGLAQLEWQRSERGSGAVAPADESPSVFGTPGYTPSERLEGKSGDARSDQFSFCAALYRAIFGVLPFTAGTIPGVGDAAKLSWPSEIEVPGWLRKAIARGLEEKPENRFQSMEALLVALSPVPRRQLWRVGLAAGVAAAAIIGWFSLGSGTAADVCAGGQERLVGTWDAERRAAVRAAFHRAGGELADVAFSKVTSAIDSYTAGWVRTYTDSCRATRVFGDQSEHLLDLRTHCLNGRLAELKGLTDLLAKADRETVAKAIEATIDLTPVAVCSDLEALGRVSPLPTDPQARNTLEAHQSALAEQIAAHRLGRMVDPGVAERAAGVARELSYEPLEALALIYLARWRQDPTVSEHDLRQALLAAVAGDARQLEAEIYVELVHQVGHLQSRQDDGRQWGRLARAAVGALGDQHELEVRLELHLGNLELVAGRHDVAESHYQQAKSIAEEIWPPAHPLHAKAVGNLGLIYANRIDSADLALNYLSRALEIEQEAFGPWNPEISANLVNLAQFKSRHGRYSEALPLAEHSLKILESFYGESHRNMLYPLLLVGQILNAADRTEAAEGHLRRALPLARTGFGEDSHLTALTLLTLVDVLLRQQRPEDAEPLLADAQRIVDQRPDSDRTLLVELKIQTGAWRNAQGEVELAAAILSEGVDLETLDPDVSRDDLRLLTALGEAEIGRGRYSRARRYLERALTLIRPGIDRHLNGEARFYLARALWPESRHQALELGRQAVEDLQSGTSPRSRHLTVRAASWLDEHEASF